MRYLLSVYYDDGSVNDFEFPFTDKGHKQMLVAAGIHMANNRVERVAMMKKVER